MRSLADLSRELVGYARGGRLAHVLHRLLHLPIGENMQERRLRELCGKPLAQRAVKHRVARSIRKIGEHDGSLAGEFRPAMRKEISARGERDYDRGCGGDEWPAAARRDVRRRRGCYCDGSGRWRACDCCG